MTRAIDLDAYFGRIGYAGSGEPTLDTLAALHLHHTRSIAFENLDPLIGRPVLLDASALERKLVHDGRGGYCYEQNLLFSHVLRALGFQVMGLAAREHPGVAEAAVTGEPDEDLGERIVAWVVPAGAAPPADELADHVARLLAPHKRPRVVHFRESLPRNEMGKVMKRSLT